MVLASSINIKDGFNAMRWCYANMLILICYAKGSVEKKAATTGN